MSVKYSVTPVFPEKEKNHSFHETFGSFVLTHDGPNSTMKQLEKILEINLQVLTNISSLLDNFDVVPEYYAYTDMLNKAQATEKDGETRKADKLRQEAENFRQNYLRQDTKPKEYWTAIADVSPVMKDFLEKLEKHPELTKQVKPDFPWGEGYFDYDPTQPLVYPIPRPSNIYEDVFQFNNYLEILQERGHRYVLFYAM